MKNNDAQNAAKIISTAMQNRGKIGKTSMTPRRASVINKAQSLFEIAKEMVSGVW